MRNKKMKAAMLMLALGIMVPAATIESRAAEAEASQETAVDAAALVEEAEAADTAETAEVVLDVTAEKKGWVEEDGGYRYYVDGNYVSNAVTKIDGQYYAFNYNGIMYTDQTFNMWDFEEQTGFTYHAKKNGVLVVNNWYKQDDYNWYYFGEEARGVQGFYTIGGQEYYFDYNGRMEKDTWFTKDGDFILIDENGYVFHFGSKPGWKRANGKYYYLQKNSDGTLGLVMNRAIKIGTKYYAFDSDGIMYENQHIWWIRNENGESISCYASLDGSLYTNQWIYEDYETYYFGADGAGANGPLVVKDKRYYFSSGQLKKSTLIKSDGNYYVVDENGICYDAKADAWTKVNNHYYYVKDGEFLTECVEKIGNYYYGFDWDGHMYDDTQFHMNGTYYRAKKGGKLYTSAWYNNYYYTKDGSAPTGLTTLSKVNYYFRDGEAISEEYICVDGKLYHADKTCALTEITKKGFYYENPGRADFVYIKNNAPIKNEWLKAAGKYYYFGEDGYAYRNGSFRIDEKNYYFNEDGTLVTSGWIKHHYGNVSFYASPSGALLTGDQKIDGVWYYFDEWGMMMTGLVETEKGTYLYGSDGAYVGKLNNGWIEVNGSWYYAKNGVFADGITTIGSQTFYFQYGKMITDYALSKGKGYLVFDSKGHQVRKGWYQIRGDWYYIKPENGYAAANEEIVIGGKSYSFDWSGHMIVLDEMVRQDGKATLVSYNQDGSVKSKKVISDGWTLHGGRYYYYKNGKAYTGWVGDFYVKAGVMLRNKITPTGYWVDQDGAYQKTKGWVKTKSGWEPGCYAKAGGKLARNEWLTIDSRQYYFGGYEGYYRVTGVQRIDGVWYIFDSEGALKVTLGKTLPDGWKQVGSSWYYFKGKNIVSGSLTIGGKTYSFTNSLMIKGPGFTYVTESSEMYGQESGRYYLNKDSQAEEKAGWRQIDGNWFYFGVDYQAVGNRWAHDGTKLYYQSYGGILTGYHVINGILYQFDGSGALVKTFNYETGWKKVGGNWYYFYDGRAVVNGVFTVGGKTYLFDGDGTLACNKRVGDYYSDANGVIVCNKLVTVNGETYYFGADGRKYSGVWKINNKIYYFD